MFQTRCQALSSKIDLDFYGAIIVDLEGKKPIALLADRSQQTVAHWLKRYHTVNSFAKKKLSLLS